MTEEDYEAKAEEFEVLSDNVPGAYFFTGVDVQVFLYRLCLFVAVFNKHKCNTHTHKMTSNSGTSLTVQWLGLCITIAGHAGSVPDQGSRFLHAAEWQNKNNKIILKHIRNTIVISSEISKNKIQRKYMDMVIGFILIEGYKLALEG